MPVSTVIALSGFACAIRNYRQRSQDRASHSNLHHSARYVADIRPDARGRPGWPG
jgi:hypothetical protein